MPKVQDDRNKEDQNAGDGQQEPRTDEDGGDAAALGGGRSDPEGHDEGFGDGFEEFQGTADLYLFGFFLVLFIWILLSSFYADSASSFSGGLSESGIGGRYEGNAADG
ncbi:MAG TPA: hypothetical protein VN734_04330 [Acidobacteriaceae bacterium]|nr:hypothetical protein [Acidobacteriaceae bacterium]